MKKPNKQQLSDEQLKMYKEIIDLQKRLAENSEKINSEIKNSSVYNSSKILKYFNKFDIFK